MVGLIISTILSTLLSGGAYYLYKRHNMNVRNELAVTYDIRFEDGRLALHALRASDAPIVEDAGRLLAP